MFTILFEHWAQQEIACKNINDANMSEKGTFYNVLLSTYMKGLGLISHYIYAR